MTNVPLLVARRVLPLVSLTFSYGDMRPLAVEPTTL
jgi:hypothetical protein